MHKCKYIKYLYGVSPTENVYYIHIFPVAVKQQKTAAVIASGV